MRAPLAAVALLCLNAAASPAAGDAVAGPALRQAVQRYKDALSKVRWSENDGNIVALYQRALGFDLDRDPDLAAQLADFLAHASPEQDTTLRHDLAGLVLVTGDEARAAPDLDYFATVAQKGGRKAHESQMFFDLMRGLYPQKGVRRAPYLKGRCARYGEGLFIEVLKRLRKRRDDVPHYIPVIDAEAAALIRSLTTGTCACGDPTATLGELREFLKAFPDDKAVPAVRDRIKAIEGGSSEIRFGCPG